MLSTFSKESRDLVSYDFVLGVDEAGRGPLAGPVVTGSFCFVSKCLDRSTAEDDEDWVTRINDSKQLTEEVREQIYDLIRNSVNGKCIAADAADDTKETVVDSTGGEAVATDSAGGIVEGPPESTGGSSGATVPKFVYAYGIVNVEEIDILNILQATMKGMAIAAQKLVDYLDAAVPGKRKRFKVLIDGNRIPEQLMGLDNIACQSIVKGDATVLSIAAASIIAKCVRDDIMRKLDVEFPEYGLADHKGYPTPAHKGLVSRIGPSRIHRLSFEPCFSLLKSGQCNVPDGRRFDEIVRAKEDQKEKRKKKKQHEPRTNNNQMSLKRMLTGGAAEEDQDSVGATKTKRRRQ